MTNIAGTDQDATEVGHDEDRPSWVVHITIDVEDLPVALTLADAMVQSLAGRYPQVVAGVTGVSHENAQRARHRVYCDRLLEFGGEGRCGYRHGHQGECGTI
jgi:hypothetical protein